VEPTATFFATLRNGNFQVSIDFNCQSVVNPVLDVSKFLSDDRSGDNYGHYQDRPLDPGSPGDIHVARAPPRDDAARRRSGPPRRPERMS
jgi:hypothetical protein